VALNERQLELMYRDVRRVSAMARQRVAERLREGRDPRPLLLDIAREVKKAQEELSGDRAWDVFAQHPGSHTPLRVLPHPGAFLPRC
jgi:hypothetical protein